MSENQPGRPLQPDLPPPGPTAPHQPDGEAQSRIADTPFQVSQEPVTAQSAPEALAQVGGFAAPAYEHLGELPASYGTQGVYLVAYDPHRLFAYWDLSPSETSEKKYSLRVCHAAGGIETHFDILPAEAGRYISAAQPGGSYYVELGTHSRTGTWQPAATSTRVTLPPEGLASEAEPKFATLPFHLSFQRLVELIDGAVGDKEELTLALSRLQRGERPALSGLFGALSHLSTEQLHTLELLLGAKFAMDAAPGASSSVFRDRQDALASPGQHSAGFSPGAAGGSENLSSLTGGLMGSEGVSSFSSALSSEGFSTR